MKDYLDGTDILGAALADPRGPFVTVHVKNIPEVVKNEATKQGAGGIASLAQGLLPATIENFFYNKVKDQISSGMKAQGVDADVKVVSDKPARGVLSSDFTVGAIAGATGVGLTYGLVQLVRHFIRRK